MQMVSLPYLSVIRFSDADAGEFLHNQVSGDVLGLDSGESTFACYCEPKGRVLALILVSRSGDDYHVIMSSSLVQAVVDRLKIYVMRSKVIIHALEELSVVGTLADPPPESSDTLPVIPIPGTGRSFLVKPNDSTDAPDKALQDNWKAWELERGITWLCPQTSGQYLPQMLGFDQLGAVNFRKGCYPGQEIVARTHYLGKVKRHPRLLKMSEDISPGLLDTVQVTSGGKTFEAITVDSGLGGDGICLLFVITRMDPDLVAEQVEYQDQKINIS